jgi:HD-GYP domain-containing protein (c-di-GMP phosphodiesterase class II)
MKRDYRKQLENAARQMILIHRVDTLARLILRTIVRNIHVDHAGIFLFDKTSGEYVVKVSKGQKGTKIPVGFTKVKSDNEIIRFFTDKNLKKYFKQDYLLHSRISYLLNNGRYRRDKNISQFMETLKSEFSLYKAKAFVPGFYRKNLIGVLFLGDKHNGKNFKPEELSFLSVLASDVVMAIQNAWFFEDLNSQLNINKKLFLSTVTALATAIEAKDRYTIGHTERVMTYSMEIAKNLSGITIPNPKEFEENLKIAALLHDIGKIGISENLLNKRAPLTDKERLSISEHPLMGVEILNPITEFKDILLGVKYHHERYDGKGYPFGLKGNEIPLAAAIISVADAYDAMTSKRPYRKAFPNEKAIQQIKLNRGKQFNPAVVDTFLRLYDRSNGHNVKQNISDSPQINAAYALAPAILPNRLIV